MSIQLTPENAQEVIRAALEALADDLDDVAVMKSRAHEPRVSREDVQARGPACD